MSNIFSIPLIKDKYIIYAPLKGIAFIANPALVNAIVDQCEQSKTSMTPYRPFSNDGSPSNGTRYELNFLQNLGFFLPDSIPMDEFRNREVQYNAVILFLTNQCNLRCAYCYASAGEYPKKELPWEIAKAAIDRVVNEVIRNDSLEMTLGFHGGGEPTLHWDIFKRSVEYSQSITQKNNIRLNVSGSFNGYWPSKVVKYAIRNLTDISLSFDGLPSVQNFQRPALGGKASFSRVEKTLRALDKSDIHYGIRMTATNDSVTRLTESIAFICENFKPRKIQIEPVFSEGRAKKEKLSIPDVDVFIDQFIKGFKIAEEHDIWLYYSGARLDEITFRFCLAACRALVVTTEGDITTCFEIFGREHPLSHRFIVGYYEGNNKFFINKKKLNKHFQRTADKIAYCADCFCKWHCAGDCAVKFVSASKDAEIRQSDRCYVNRELTKFLLLKKIQYSGGLFWLKNAPITERFCATRPQFEEN